MDIVARIAFPGGKRVDAEVGRHLVRTDQPVENGGEGSAPEPFALFAASIGTCAGLYVLAFCTARDLPTEGLALHERLRFDGDRLVAIEIDVELPPGFPERYRDAVLRAAEGCKVKRAMEAQPRFVVRMVPATRAA